MTPIDVGALTEQITQLMNTIIQIVLLIVVIKLLMSALKPAPKEEVPEEEKLAPARKQVRIVGGTLEVEE